MKTEAVKNEVLNFISLQPLFHYGVPPLSIRADSYFVLKTISPEHNNVPMLTFFVREDSYFVAVSQKLCNICIRIYINYKRHITENNDGYVPSCFCKAVISQPCK